MPRTTTTKKDIADAEPKRTARRTVAKRVTTRAPRTRRKDDVVEDEVTVKSTSAPRRKAPTVNPPLEVFASELSHVPQKEKARRTLYVSGALFSIGLIAAVMIGYTDSGQIDTSSIITQHNDRVTSGQVAAGGDDTGGQGGTTERVIPVQNSANQLPNGGLVPVSDDVAAAIAAMQPASEGESVATSSATSTDVSTDTATTTPTETDNGTESDLPTEDSLPEMIIDPAPPAE